MKYLILILIIFAIIGGLYLALSTSKKPIFEKPNIENKKSDYERYIKEDSNYELDKGKG